MEKIVEYINFDSSNKFTLIFTSTTSRPVTRGNSGLSLHSKSHSPVFRKISGTKVSNPHYNDTHLVNKKHQHHHSEHSSTSNHFSEQNRQHSMNTTANSVTLHSRSHSIELEKSLNQREDSFLISMDETNNNNNQNNNYTTPVNSLNNDEMFDQLMTKVWLFYFYCH